MATCPNCRTYTDDERAKVSESFVCRKCNTPLTLHAVESGEKKGKGSKGSKGSKGGKGKKGQPTSVGVMMPLESDLPFPKENSEDEDSTPKARGSSSSSSKPVSRKSEDEDDLPPKPKMPPPPPPKPSLLDGPIVLVGIGVVCFVLGLAVGVLVF